MLLLSIHTSFDVEGSSQFNKGKTFIDSIVTAFCSEMEKVGYYAGLYMSASPLKTHVSESVRSRYTIWVAQYNSKCTYEGAYGIWQYSSKGNVPGVSGNCDMNESYQDFPAIIEKAGLNGYAKGGGKTVDEIAREVLDGKWGNGDDRKNRITAAGYDYKVVQRKVNELLR